MGWLTVVAYFVAAWLCFRNFSAQRGPDGGTPTGRFWLALVLTLVALGINKQLDLQTALTDIGRSLAHAQGWFTQRHIVQIAFIATIAVLTCIALVLLVRMTRPLSTGRLMALTGAVLLASFVLIRAASFHHIDYFIRETVLGLRWNWILELSGISAVAVGAVLDKSALARYAAGGDA